jgi:flagellar hook-basal body complex protein FliE
MKDNGTEQNAKTLTTKVITGAEQKVHTVMPTGLKYTKQ